jgi:hypothetical protein
MRGRVHAIRTLKGLVADLRIIIHKWINNKENVGLSIKLNEHDKLLIIVYTLSVLYNKKLYQ